MNDADVICIRCCEADAADEQGYCGHCYWAVRVELHEGLELLEEYVRNWARFSDWCVEHGRAA